MEGLLTKDRLDIDEVILKVYCVKLQPRPKLPKDWQKWTDTQRDANDAWQEAKYEAIGKIENKWGWR